jgi:hypothetical protein
MKNCRDKVIALLLRVRENKDLELSDLTIPDPPPEKIFLAAKEKTGIDWHNTLYDTFDGLGMKWTQKQMGDPDVKGIIKILQMEKMMQDWNLDRDDPAMKDFFILDLFMEETCVGFYKGLDYLYLYDMGGETEPLFLDFNGYLEVCLAAEGFLYWPVIVRGVIDNKIVPEAERFDKYMPGIFKDASIEKIRETYERVKIGKK